MDNTTEEKIKDLLSGFMKNLIKKRTVLQPFNPLEIENVNPFGFRLAPIEIWKGSKFERSFVTALGQKVFEKLAKIVAEGTGAFAQNQYDTEITINSYRAEKIDEILKMQRGAQKKRQNKAKTNTIQENFQYAPNWNKELNEILSLHNQKFETLRVRFDLYIKRTNASEEFYSIKTVKPNLDQTEIAKRDMLRIKSVNENIDTYFALPYNPAGEGENYKKVHSIPYRIFNMDEDKCVLIGSTFWNKVGQDENTYNDLLRIFKEIGKTYEPIIKKDYLGINS